MMNISVRINDPELEAALRLLIDRQPVRASDGAFLEGLARQAVVACDAAPDNPLAWMKEASK